MIKDQMLEQIENFHKLQIGSVSELTFFVIDRCVYLVYLAAVPRTNTRLPIALAHCLECLLQFRSAQNLLPPYCPGISHC